MTSQNIEDLLCTILIAVIALAVSAWVLYKERKR
jgi:heme/copper-type cytochrome/quinol oxidase subunit 4